MNFGPNHPMSHVGTFQNRRTGVEFKIDTRSAVVVLAWRTVGIAVVVGSKGGTVEPWLLGQPRFAGKRERDPAVPNSLLRQTSSDRDSR